MSRSAQAIKAEMKAVAARAHDAYENRSLTTAAVRTALDDAESKLKSLTAELADATQVDGAYAFLAECDDDVRGPSFTTGTKSFGNTRPFGLVGVKSLDGPPPVAMTTAQMHELYDAVTNLKSVSIDLKATSTSQAVAIPEYRTPPLPVRREPQRVADLLPQFTTDAGSLKYFRATTAATAASVVAEGGTKPESSLVLEAVDAVPRKIAHRVKLNDETLADYAQFASYVGTEMLAGLVHEENHQLLLGTGTSPQIPGILTNTDVVANARPVGSDTKLDAIAKAITDIRTSSVYAEADGIVLHPTDYETLVLSKDGEERYLAVNPVTGPVDQLWGLRVRVTTQITQGTALVGAFAEGATVIWRMAPRVEFLSSGSDWEANITQCRAEERLTIAVARPDCFVPVTGL